MPAILEGAQSGAERVGVYTVSLTHDFEGSTFLWGNDYIHLDFDDNFIIEPILPLSGLINMYGKPKTLKSFAAIGMAIAISSGLPEWNGLKVQRHGPVAYLQLDTPRGEWIRRFRRIAAAGYDISKIAIMDLNIAPYPYNIASPKHAAWLKLQLDSIKPIFVVVDTLRESHEGNENDSKDMKIVMGNIVRAAAPAAIAFVSHSRKDSAFNQMGHESDLMDEGRGSSYISGRMDTIIKFSGFGKNNPNGSMTYKGRSAEETRVNLVKDPETFMPVLEGSEEKKDLLLMTMLRDHGPGSSDEWTFNQMALAIAAEKIPGLSRSNADKRLKQLHDRLVVDSKRTAKPVSS